MQLTLTYVNADKRVKTRAAQWPHQFVGESAADWPYRFDMQLQLQLQLQLQRQRFYYISWNQKLVRPLDPF